ncbi:CPBP family intramembrane metalloprotease [Plectonema cf. radiosum LEGE 06105]|uniref:CPBP family intramembrane metalloprotease n=1 Tax=Plectonema cf. radiosum LEGE 06105 TaxID=945769 RepID=A0A8J7F2D0_9CYAN|nr:CPBP family intramembrane glutamic endopeptidase [Plectonema radiosum]MBE9214843.1 CPBP family intramembrane metalloprotease [Plectonema cf. radiosum LEGE 06105]
MKINLVSLAQRPAPIRLGCFVLCLLLPWLPYAAAIYILVKDENTRTILTMGILAVEFLFLLPWWSKYIHQQSQTFSHYGLEFTRLWFVELLRGVAIGLISILILYGLQGIFGWLIWQQPSFSMVQLVLEGLISALGIAFAEELFFRGFIYDELQRDYDAKTVIWGVAMIFALLHFIKPLPEIIRTSPQFLGLLLLGLACVWAKRSCRGRLGLPIGIHGGLVWGVYIIEVGKLIKYTGTVPQWITGIDNNPLVGIMGLLGLTLLALWTRQKQLKLLKIPVENKSGF